MAPGFSRLLTEFEAAKRERRSLLQEARKKHRRAIHALPRRHTPAAQVEAMRSRHAEEIRQLDEEFQAWVRATIEQVRKGA